MSWTGFSSARARAQAGASSSSSSINPPSSSTPSSAIANPIQPSPSHPSSSSTPFAWNNAPLPSRPIPQPFTPERAIEDPESDDSSETVVYRGPASPAAGARRGDAEREAPKDASTSTSRASHPRPLVRLPPAPDRASPSPPRPSSPSEKAKGKRPVLRRMDSMAPLRGGPARAPQGARTAWKKVDGDGGRDWVQRWRDARGRERRWEREVLGWRRSVLCPEIEHTEYMTVDVGEPGHPRLIVCINQGQGFEWDLSRFVTPKLRHQLAATVPSARPRPTASSSSSQPPVAGSSSRSANTDTSSTHRTLIRGPDNRVWVRHTSSQSTVLIRDPLGPPNIRSSNSANTSGTQRTDVIREPRGPPQARSNNDPYAGVRDWALRYHRPDSSVNAEHDSAIYASYMREHRGNANASVTTHKGRRRALHPFDPEYIHQKPEPDVVDILVTEEESRALWGDAWDEVRGREQWDEEELVIARARAQGPRGEDGERNGGRRVRWRDDLEREESGDEDGEEDGDGDGDDGQGVNVPRRSCWVSGCFGSRRRSQ